METDKNIDFIFKENKESKVIKKKSIFKRIIVLSIILFFLLNLSFYVGFYNNYVRHAPEQLKNGRQQMIVAHVFAMYETSLVKLGISFANPILRPFQIPKEYFYNKGVEYLPKNDADRVYWYALLMYYPISYEIHTSDYSEGDISKNYGKTFTKSLLNDIYKNLEVLAKYELSDFEQNKYIQKKLTWLTNFMFETYVYNYHLLEDSHFYTNKVLREAQNTEKINKLIKVYNFMKTIFNKGIYKSNFFTRDIIKIPKYEQYFYESFFESNALVFYNRIFYNKFKCDNVIDKMLMKDFIKFNFKLNEIRNNKSLSSGERKHLAIILNETPFILQIQKIINECIKK